LISFFIEECDHNSEKTSIDDLEFRVPFEKRKLNLSVFTFDEPTNNQAFENIIQESLTDQSFEKLFENELICLDESVRDALVSYTLQRNLLI